MIVFIDDMERSWPAEFAGKLYRRRGIWFSQLESEATMSMHLPATSYRCRCSNAQSATSPAAK
jgi:hypothetical protein